MSDTTANTFKEQATLPFGTSLDAETSGTSGTGSSGAGAPSNQRFTSYDRSGATGLDYAVNRTYNSGQSRFTQVDPIGMASASIGNPQSLNLFAYVGNDPVGFIDPEGLMAIDPSTQECRYELVITYTEVEILDDAPEVPILAFQGNGGTNEGFEYTYVLVCENKSKPQLTDDPGTVLGRETVVGSQHEEKDPPKICGTEIENEFGSDVKNGILGKDEFHMIFAILGEATGAGAIGTNEFSDSQGGTRQKRHAGIGREITSASILLEGSYIAQVIRNRVASKSYPNTVAQVVEQPGQVLGYKSGKSRWGEYYRSLPDSDDCLTLKLAIRSTFIINSKFTGVQWRGVFQNFNPKTGTGFVRNRSGAIRLAGTDFF
ncbi:MAG: RHS repeat-associated core domain-containing protein [Pyrinomonadaceae bacterium]